jgi:hypothetical protein
MTMMCPRAPPLFVVIDATMFERTVPTNTWIGDGSELTSHNKRLGVVDADSEGEMYVDG